jgi:GTP pyrophosphokinase
MSIEGKEILKRKLKQFKIKLDDKISIHMMKFFKINASNDLYYNIGIGKIDNKKIKQFVSDYNSSFIGFIRRRIGSNNKKVDKINESEHSIKFDKLIFGKDQELLKYSMANCCDPIPGDPVFGFVSVNDGIKVRKKDCPNSISLRSNYAYRIIFAKWIDSQSHEFNTKINLTGIDDIGIISQIAATISDSMNVNMNKLSFESNDGFFSGTMNLEVKNKVILNKLLISLKKIKGIDKVSRN